MDRQSGRHGAQIGTLAGMALAVVFLIVVGVLLVRPHDSGYRALVTVWLWALPALGVFGCAGWLVGKGIDVTGAALTSGSARQARDHQHERLEQFPDPPPAGRSSVVGPAPGSDSPSEVGSSSTGGSSSAGGASSTGSSVSPSSATLERGPEGEATRHE